MNKGLILLVATMLVFYTGTVRAQEFNATVDDQIALQNCIETVRDVNSALEPGQRPAHGHECIGIASDACLNGADGNTTLGMVGCLARETDWWDGQLNDHYSFLRENLDQSLFASLRDVQRKWIAYKEASCRFEYDSWEGGSIRQPASASCYMNVTAIRALELGEIVTRFSQ